MEIEIINILKEREAHLVTQEWEFASVFNESRDFFRVRTVPDNEGMELMEHINADVYFYLGIHAHLPRRSRSSTRSVLSAKIYSQEDALSIS